ncbi:MAG TPA: hypothetical protein VGJ43_07065 [Acidimicrobiales bacterium]
MAKLVPRWSVTLGNVVVSGSLLLTFERDGAARWQHALAGGVVVVGE